MSFRGRSLMLSTLVAVAFGVAAAPTRVEAQNTIADRVINYNRHTGEFDTLIAAVLEADPLVLDALAGPGPLTVFLPTDFAFAQLGLDPGNVAQLGPDLLTEILLYHVTLGRNSLQALLRARTVNTALGEPVVFSRDPRNIYRVFVNDARILNHAIPASNGYIFIIDQVLLPEVP